MAKARVNRALKHSTPDAADVMYTPGDMVLVWREKIVNNRIGEWMGPYKVEGFDPSSKIVHIREKAGAPVKTFNVNTHSAVLGSNPKT